MSGILWGVGVGPGDPDLMTFKAAAAIAAAPVIAYPANPQGISQARTIAQNHIRPGCVEIPLVMDFAPDRASARAAYESGCEIIAAHLDAGRDVAVLCEGDPLLWGSFTYVLDRLGGRAAVKVVPGVSALTACAAAACHTLVQGEEPLVCAPATLPEPDLIALLQKASACALFKVGRHAGKAARALAAAGLAEGALCVVEASRSGQRVLPLAEAVAEGVPYFSLILARRPAP